MSASRLASAERLAGLLAAIPADRVVTKDQIYHRFRRAEVAAGRRPPGPGHVWNLLPRLVRAGSIEAIGFRPTKYRRIAEVGEAAAPAPVYPGLNNVKDLLSRLIPEATAPAESVAEATAPAPATCLCCGSIQDEVPRIAWVRGGRRESGDRRDVAVYRGEVRGAVGPYPPSGGYRWEVYGPGPDPLAGSGVVERLSDAVAAVEAIIRILS